MEIGKTLSSLVSNMEICVNCIILCKIGYEQIDTFVVRRKMMHELEHIEKDRSSVSLLTANMFIHTVSRSSQHVSLQNTEFVSIAFLSVPM